MRHLIAIIALVLPLSLFGQEFTFDYHTDFKKILDQTNDPSDPLYYDTLLGRFQRNDTTLTDYEVLALLIGFTDNEHFWPYRYLPAEREMYSLNDEGKYSEALILCDSLLQYVPVSQQALIEKSYACHKLGNKEDSERSMWRFRKIMYAMARSGDGTTPETGFFSLGPADGQNLIKKTFSAKIGTMGSGADKYDNFVDILEIIKENKQTGQEVRRQLYFQIQHAIDRMFEPDDMKKLDEGIRKSLIDYLKKNSPEEGGDE